MSLDQALDALRAAKRISGTRASYAKDNPGEYAKVVAYLDGGARPTGTLTQMGQGLVLVEDERRQVEPPPPPPPPSGHYFNGSFDTGDLSRWRDFHDAHLNASPPGFQVVPRPGGGYMARCTVQQWPDTSEWGDAAVLWEGSGGNAYSLPYLQRGQTTWHYLGFVLPDGTDPRYPGQCRLGTGGAEIYILQEWHTNPGIVPNAYSTMVMVHRDRRFEFRVRGGSGEGALNQLWANTTAQFNHRYELLVKLTFHESQGRAEWWLDGVEQPAKSCPTLAIAGNGSVPGVGHEIGIYRGASVPGSDVVYFDQDVFVGPTRESVEG